MRNEVVVPSIPNSSLHISGFGRKAKSDYICDIHVHSEFEILKMLDGQTEFYIYDKTYHLKSGDIIFVNNKVPHSTSIHKGSSAFYIQFRTEIHPDDSSIHISKYFLQFINIANEDVIVFKEGTDLNRAISISLLRILDEYTTKKTAYEVFIKSCLYNILALLFRNKILIHPETYFNFTDFKKLLPVIEYIDTNYSSQITLSQISEIMHINKSYLCRLFKKAINTSFVQYLNFVRICKAEKLLLTTSKNISEISYETGFSSLQYFNRIFKKYKNCTPKMYKKINMI